MLSPRASPTVPAINVGFSPKRGSLDLVLKVIDSCKERIQIAAYGFTSQPIADALVSKYNKGVSISVVADYKASLQQSSVLSYLTASNIPVRTNKHYAIHHNKFLICDSKTVETGSFNYTEGAVKRNAENVVVIWNHSGTAQTYMDEWKRLWDESQ